MTFAEWVRSDPHRFERWEGATSQEDQDAFFEEFQNLGTTFSDGGTQEVDTSQSWTDKLGIPKKYTMDGKDYFLLAPDSKTLNQDPMVQGGHWDWDKMVTTPEGYVAVPLDYAESTLGNWAKAAGLNEMSGWDKIMKAATMAVLAYGVGSAAAGAAGFGGAGAVAEGGELLSGMDLAADAPSLFSGNGAFAGGGFTEAGAVAGGLDAAQNYASLGADTANPGAQFMTPEESIAYDAAQQAAQTAPAAKEAAFTLPDWLKPAGQLAGGAGTLLSLLGQQDAGNALKAFSAGAGGASSLSSGLNGLSYSSINPDLASQQEIDGSMQSIYDDNAAAGIPGYDPDLVSPYSPIYNPNAFNPADYNPAQAPNSGGGLMGPSAYELGVPGATGYDAPYPGKPGTVDIGAYQDAAQQYLSGNQPAPLYGPGAAELGVPGATGYDAPYPGTPGTVDLGAYQDAQTTNPVYNEDNPMSYWPQTPTYGPENQADLDDAEAGQAVDQTPIAGGPPAATQQPTDPGLWSRILNNTATPDDWAKVLGTAGSTAASIWGANKQADALRDSSAAALAEQRRVADQMFAIGAPARARLEQTYTDPDYFTKAYGPQFDRMADVAARTYSVRGNPAGNPTIGTAIQSDVWNQGYLPMVNNERGQLGQHGGLGLNMSGAAGLQAAQAMGNSGQLQAGLMGRQYNDLATGINSLLYPPNNDAEILKKYGITVGGVAPK